MKPFKIIYYIFIIFVVVIVLFLIASIFPITGNWKIMIVQSGSMEPAIKTGSVVITKPAAEYNVGNIITFTLPQSPKRPITHRINEIKTEANAISYITKGDANNGPDQEEIKKENIIGKVLLSVPYLGYAVDVAKNPYGFIAIIIIPALIIIYDEIKKIRNEVKKIRKKTKEGVAEEASQEK